MSRPRGYTIIEMVIVLMILGVALALAAPGFARSVSTSTDTRVQVIAAARGAAIDRAETLSLDIGQDGRWVLSEPGAADHALSGGTIANPGAALRLNLSPAGLCIPNAGSGQDNIVVDPLSCAVAQAPVNSP